MVPDGGKVGETLAWSLWVQLCGRVAVARDGQRVESHLPGRLGVCLLGYLAANSDRWVTRDELVYALWADAEPTDAEASLASLLSKVRRVVGPETISGRSSLRFVATDDMLIDLHYAADALHRATSLLEAGNAHGAWQPAHTAYAITRRTFLHGYDAAWIDEWRRRVEELEVRSLDAFVRATTAVGELAVAEQLARELLRRAPFRESSYELLMCVLERCGNVAEALHVYEQLRALLADELGTSPGPELAAHHRRLLLAGE